MKSDITPQSTSLYDTDYQLWLEQTRDQLKVRDFGNLDLENLIEEIESLGRSDKRQAGYLGEYQNGRKLFLDGSGFDPAGVPQSPEFTLEQSLDQDWLPWQPPGVRDEGVE
jgi:hypothetical protein